MNIYTAQVGNKPPRGERSKSKGEKRAKTPKIKDTRRVIIMPIDEKTEEELEKEQKAKREAAEKIRKRQEQYMKDL